MSSHAIRLQEIDDTLLEEFIEIWIEKRSQKYARVERIGAANDKGRDVIGFLSERRHEGPWDLFQCKRKTRGGRLGTPEAMTELGKLFHNHVEGAYATLPMSYVFVAPRGVVGPLQDLIFNPSRLGPYLIDNWHEYCAPLISKRRSVALTPEIRKIIEVFDFSRVTHLSATMIVKDPAAAPALSKVLGLIPEEAPPGVTPQDIQLEELVYVNQLRQVYHEASGLVFDTADDVLADPKYGEHLRRQRRRFFEAAYFSRFHRDNTAPGAVDVFIGDVFDSVIEVHGRKYGSRIERVDAVMERAGGTEVSLLGRTSRVPVRQGMCHHLVNEGRLAWNP